LSEEFAKTAAELEGGEMVLRLQQIAAIVLNPRLKSCQNAKTKCPDHYVCSYIIIIAIAQFWRQLIYE
jgi:hypothetical protein